MNYEELYEELQKNAKSLDSSIKSAAKYCKAILKDNASGDLKDMDKAIASLKEALENEAAALEEVQEVLDGFDRAEYISGGQFEKQLIKECRAQGIDVHNIGKLVYEMFPNKVTINEETQDVTIDKKKLSSLRPSAVANVIRTTQDKMEKASFNESKFLGELQNAYDLVILKKKKKDDQAPVALTDVYKMLVPMGRLKKEYDIQSFAFDIARLYRSGLKEASDGRILDLGPSKNNNNAIRVLDENGKEEFFAMIAFLKG